MQAVSDLRRFFATKFDKLRPQTADRQSKSATDLIVDYSKRVGTEPLPTVCRMTAPRHSPFDDDDDVDSLDTGKFVKQESLRSLQTDTLFVDLDMRPPIREHHLTVAQLADVYPLSRLDIKTPETSSGLNNDEAEIKLRSTPDRNVVCPGSAGKGGTLGIFLKKFRNTFRFLLLFACVCCLLAFLLDHSHFEELLMAIILLVVLVLLGVVSYYEELKALRRVQDFQSVVGGDCCVIRSGRKATVPSELLVVGDFVWLRGGDRIPADLRIVYSDQLRVETSWLSGEPQPLLYTAQCASNEIGIFEAQNVVFAGCSVVSGIGLGLVIRIGNSTVLGTLVDASSRRQPRQSPLKREHRRFVFFVTLSALVVASCSLVMGLTLSDRHAHFLTLFVNTFLVVIVACVPQGLPVIITAQLLIVARRLAAAGMYLKRLDLADVLGCTSLLIVDKTAAFTQNDLRVTDVWAHGTGMTVDSLVKAGRRASYADDPVLDHLFTVMSVCDRAHIRASAPALISRKTPSFRRKNLLSRTLSRASARIYPAKQPRVPVPAVVDTGTFMLKHKDLAEKSVVGKRVDVALIKFVERFTSVEDIREAFDVVYEVPFTGQKRRHLVIAREKTRPADSLGDDDVVRHVVMVKGAPEKVIVKCSSFLTPNGPVPLDDEQLDAFETSFLQYGGTGKSCIGFAMKEFDDFADTEFYVDPEEGANFPTSGWVFVGMAALDDPPLPGIREAVRTASEAGIRLWMVSGDHAVAASAIAQQHFGGECGVRVGEKAKPAEVRNGDAEHGNGRKESLEEIKLDVVPLAAKGDVEVIQSDLVKDFTSADWTNLLTKQRLVFARTTPRQKALIASKCRAAGVFVAMTGDAVADASSLRAADVGLALDSIGSVYAKEAADIVVARPGLPQILAAIEQARLLVDNLKKTIAFSLSHVVPEVLSVWLGYVLGFPLGLTSLQILAIDLFADLPPAVALVYEPPERDLMRRPPRPPTARLVTRSLLAYSYLLAGPVIAVNCILAYFCVFWAYNVSLGDLYHSAPLQWRSESPELVLATGRVLSAADQVHVYHQASAAWHITLVVSQTFHLVMCTTRRVSLFVHGLHNRALAAAIAFQLTVLFLIVFVPGLNSLFHLQPPPLFAWLFPISAGITLLAFNETRKHLIRAYPKNALIRMLKW